MKHSDYITHINNKEDEVYLRNKHFPVNMRLFNTSTEYRQIILQQCQYIRNLCLQQVEGYKNLMVCLQLMQDLLLILLELP
jgi:hypothetical protein